MQFQVCVPGAATEYVHVIEEVMDTPLTDLRLEVTGGDGHPGLTLLAEGDQEIAYVGLAPDEGGAIDVRVVAAEYDLFVTHRSEAGIRMSPCRRSQPRGRKVPSFRR